MSKSIKPKNNTYWDSSSIVHNKELLSDILNGRQISLSFNWDYIYDSDINYNCFKIGKIVIVNIQVIAFKKEIPNHQVFISGLPKPTEYNIFYLFGGGTSEGTTARCSLTYEGNIQIHWGSPTSYGDAANKQYSGILIYKTIE